MQLAYAVLAVIILTGCKDPQSSERGGFARPPTEVVVTSAQIRTIHDELEAIGTTKANESITLTAQVTDTVSHVRFEDGDLVEMGDVLVELTNEEETALLAEAEANAKDAETQFNRLYGLLANKSVSQSLVDEAEAKYDAAQARYQSILARLRDRLVLAPFSGLLGFRVISPGSLLTPTTPITTLDDVSIIKLDFSIPEVHLGLVKPGMALIARSPAYPDEHFAATVRTIGSRIDEVTRAATVRALINNDDLLLRQGMLMTVRLTTAERKSLMVPEIALLQRADEVFVYVVGEDNIARLQAIESGVRDGGWVEVLDGLSPGQEVITEGVIKVRNNAQVRILGRPDEQVAERERDDQQDRMRTRPSGGAN